MQFSRIEGRHKAEPSKLNSAGASAPTSSDGDTERAAQPTLKNVGLVVRILALAELPAKTLNFEHRLWST